MRTLMQICVAVVAFTAMLSTTALGDQSVGGTAEKGGTIAGVIKYDGKTPDRKEIAMNGDPFCVKFHNSKKPPLEEKYIFSKDGKALKNGFVYVSGGLAGKKFDAPKTPYVIDQVGCTYHPHVGGIVWGQELHIKNSDPTLHNVHGMPKLNAGWNVGQPAPGMVHKQALPIIEEGILIKCDVHAWMNSYVHVVPHPFFAVSNDEGKFTIKGLPDGEYELKTWHEFRVFAPDKDVVKVTIKDGGTVDVSVTYAPKKKE